MKINTGISDLDRKTISDGLSRLLADHYILYLKTQNYHWNVTGPMFGPLHALFESQYRDMAEANDLLAERIRALGFRAPASFSEYSKLSTITENGATTHARAMIQSLLDGHEAILRVARTVYATADAARDYSTADLINTRLEFHEKAAWMLRSQLQD